MNIIAKRIMSASIVAVAAASLAACGSVANIQSQISSIESQVQSDANLACGFVPTIASIAAFIPGAGAVAADAATIAQGICAAIASAPVVKPLSLAHRRAVALGVDVTVGVVQTPNGPVTVTGHFTR